MIEPTIVAIPPHDLDAEQAVLGAILLTEKALGPIHADVGLRAVHFYTRRHELVYAAMVSLSDQGAGVDRLSIIDELRRTSLLDEVGGETEVDALTGAVPAVGNARRYAEIVVELAVWRDRLTASHEIQAAVHSRDHDAYVAAEALLTAPPEHGRQRAFTREELGTAVLEMLQAGPVETFPWPFRRFNYLTRGGMRRGQVTLISGPTSHGKSVMVDMALQSASVRQGARVGLFVNEMTAKERVLRVVARMGQVSYTKLELASAGFERMSPEEYAVIMRVLGEMPFDIIECAGWTSRDICREARRRQLDVVGFDIIQRLPHLKQSRVAELEEASNDFDRLAKEGGCHVLICAHINRARSGQSAVVPFPTDKDIRDCAQLANDADNLLFVWREQDSETGDPLPESVLRFGKARGGERGGVNADFVGDHQEFVPVVAALKAPVPAAADASDLIPAA